MQPSVKTLLDFHGTSNFGGRENLNLQQAQARLAYLALDIAEQKDLAAEVISEIAKGNDRFERALCCLACFLPGSLALFHEELVDRRILYPGVIFYGATSAISRKIIPVCDQSEYCNHALVALAWIGDDIVQSAFSKWRKNLPSWDLYIPPHQYAEEAGWELTTRGRRRDLFHSVAFPLIPPGEASRIDDAVSIGMECEETCRWCKRKLVGLFEIGAIEKIFPGQGEGPVRVVTCHVCTCFGPLFMKYGPTGEAQWHEKNVKPSYLPSDSLAWDPFPRSPLVMTKEKRHFLEGANWSMLPGVAFSQVGGLPTWIQDAGFPACPDCSQKMLFIGQISNEDFMEYGEGIYYAFHCPTCNVTATSYQQT